MIKTIFTFIIAISLFLQVDAQNTDPLLKADFDNYFATMQAKDYEKTLDFMYPDIFEIYPREMLLQAMQSVDSDSLTIITFDNSSISETGDLVTYENTNYTLISYAYDMSIQVLEDENEEDSDFDGDDMMKSLFELSYGEGNVKHDTETNTFHISVEKTMYAVKAPSYDTWKFIEKAESTVPIIEKLFPKKALKKLK